MDKTKEKLSKSEKAQKFFFDQNCFDDDFEEEIVPEEPPPPTFSEDELAAEKDEAYKRGHRDGLSDAKVSREKQIAMLIGTINGQFQTLFGAEQLREKQYENEAVLLALRIFQKLFPLMNQKYGLGEVESVIKSVLEKQKDHNEIIIEVSPDYADSIRERLQPLLPQLPAHCRFIIRSKESLGPGDCEMNWHDGGTTRDISHVSQEIQEKLEHMLADKPTLQDNGKNDQQNTPIIDDAADGEEI